MGLICPLYTRRMKMVLTMREDTSASRKDYQMALKPPTMDRIKAAGSSTTS